MDTKLRDALYRLDKAQEEEQSAMDSVIALLGRPADGDEFLRVLNENCGEWMHLTCVQVMRIRHGVVAWRMAARR